MSLADHLSNRRLLYAGGRRFVVHRPTVGTVFAFLGLFPREILVMIHAAEDGASREAVLRVALAEWARPTPRVLEVLGTIVETEEPFQAWPIAEIAKTALAMLDLDRVLKLMDLKRIAAETKDLAEKIGTEEDEGTEGRWSGDLDDQEVALISVARAFGIAPTAVMAWPIESYISVVAYLNLGTAPAREGTETDAVEALGKFAHLGIGIERTGEMGKGA